MATINERIVQLRKELSLSMDKFGERIGVSRSVIKNIEYNLTEPKPLLLKQICKEFKVDPDWLETGEGDMFLPAEEEDELLHYAMEVMSNKDLDWIKQLILTLKNMSPEELDVMEKFAMNWLDRMNSKEKEQD